MSSEAVAFDLSRSEARHAPVDRVLLKAPVVFCVGSIRDDVRGLLPESLNVWRLIEVSAASIQVEIAEGQVRELQRPPLLTCAILARNDGLALATQAAAWLRDHGARVVPEPTTAAAENLPQLTGIIAGQFVKLLTSQADCITGLAREVAQFRISNETLQNNFRAAEGVLERKGLQPYDLDFVNEPADSHINVLKDASLKRVTQVLPVGSTGVSAVGIHLATVPPRSNGFLKAQITSLEDGVLLGTWSVPIADLHRGWNVFGFERSLTGLPRTLELSVAVAGGNADLPCLSLGVPQPVERFRVHDSESRQALADASLALQVWAGLADVALPSWATYWSSHPKSGVGPDVPLRQEVIAPDILSFATHDNADQVQFSFDAVQALISERAVSCHPPANGITIARLPGACPAGALRVSATALVDNAQAQDVEFALVTTTTGERAREIFSGQSTPIAGESFSAWVKVSPMDKKSVNAFIGQPVARWQDIFIATRMAEPGNNDFAWAKFQHLTTLSQDLT